MKLFLIKSFLFIFVTGNLFAATNINEKYQNKIIDNSGKDIGYFIATQGNEGVLLEVNLLGLKAGKHGMHFHEVGSCEDHNAFKKSKGHIIKNNKPHGFLHEKGPHSGNLPNIIVDKNGNAHVELYTQLVSLKGSRNLPNLLDNNGSALIIHEFEDDHISQPIGGAGARVACGVIK